jgi:hypothetical protein
LSEKRAKRDKMSVIPDIFMIIGFFLLEFGLYSVYPPAMCIVGGILLILLGYPKKGVE